VPGPLDSPVFPRLSERSSSPSLRRLPERSSSRAAARFDGAMGDATSRKGERARADSYREGFGEEEGSSGRGTPVSGGRSTPIPGGRG